MLTLMMFSVDKEDSESDSLHKQDTKESLYVI